MGQEHNVEWWSVSNFQMAEFVAASTFGYRNPEIKIIRTQSADRTVSSFGDSSAQHRENEAEPDSNEK